NSPSQREGAGGWVPSVTNTAAASNQLDALSPSRREGAGGRVLSVTTAASSPHEPDALPPSQREGAGGRACLDSPTPLLPSSPAPLFCPNDPTAAAIINDFAAQDETLRGIALKYDTTLESLTLWLARPDIKERIFALESACAARARLVVANNLAAIANKLLHLLTESKLDHESIHRVPAPTNHAFAARMQSRESARKTANLLLRIARYIPSANPAPHAPPPSRNPTRQRGVTAAHIALQTPEDQQHSPAPPLPARRGEDRLAAGQAGEGTDAHLSAHAVQYKAAAPTTNPTPQRVTTTTPHPARAASFTSN
ncbi:MAG: hypothetical protein ACK58T_20080, partial [Phycisphaerae bacterium]